jgi:hypothetical protein
MAGKNRFVFNGLEELRKELRELPEKLAGEGGRLVESHGNAAVVTLKQFYGQHRHTGNLQDSVAAETRHRGSHGSTLVFLMIIKVHSPLAWLFDNGSQARHYITKQTGEKHETGAMWGNTAPNHILVKTMTRARRALNKDLWALLERAGLSVTGHA